MHEMRQDSVECTRSWHAAFVTLLILSISFGAPLIIIVGMKQIQAALHADRAVLSMATALVWIGNGLGGIVMGWLAERIGVRRIVLLGIMTMASGLTLSSLGNVPALLIGHGVLIGFLGNGALYAPLIVYVSRWFDRRRGTAIALIASGQYIAGILWPTVIQFGMNRYGWQATMLLYAVFVLALLPLLPLLLPAPASSAPNLSAAPGAHTRSVLGLPPNVAMILICLAGFLCCVPMALPASHLVAFCGDLGIPAFQGAAMLSVLLACAFLSRQFWGIFADRYGGLRTIMAGSTFQMLALAAFLLTRNEVGLFTVAGVFGLGFSGIFPAYSVAIRDLFPSHEASWRIPVILFTLMAGMAFGSWFGGWLYDLFLSYSVAFTVGVLFNLGNLIVIVFLVSRMPRDAQPQPQRSELARVV